MSHNISQVSLTFVFLDDTILIAWSLTHKSQTILDVLKMYDRAFRQQVNQILAQKHLLMFLLRLRNALIFMIGKTKNNNQVILFLLFERIEAYSQKIKKIGFGQSWWAEKPNFYLKLIRKFSMKRWFSIFPLIPCVVLNYLRG